MINELQTYALRKLILSDMESATTKCKLELYILKT